MQKTFKECDNNCIERFGRQKYVCWIYKNCNKFHCSEKDRITILTDDLKVSSYSLSEIIPTIESKIGRNLDDTERNLVCKRFSR